MSVRVMASVWEADLPPMEKLVLLALADCANDEGHCWPAASTLARKSGQGERTVRRAVQSLIAKGHLSQRQRSGTSAVYKVHPCHTGTPATQAPLPHRPPTPATQAPKPLRTINSSEAKASKQAEPDFLIPADIPAEPFKGFVEMRKGLKKPMNNHAKHLAVLRLRKLRDEEGWPPGEVLNHSTLNSYQGLFPPKDRKNGHAQPNPNPRSRLLDALTAADEAIARSAFDEDHAGTWLALPPAGTG
jgi:hypothetical protein